MVKNINKLVRDKIPQIIESSGRRCRYRTIKREELTQALWDKLTEEVEEFRQTPNLEELADVMEALFSLADEYGWSWLELEEVRQAKRELKGGFIQGKFLETITAN